MRISDKRHRHRPQRTVGQGQERNASPPGGRTFAGPALDPLSGQQFRTARPDNNDWPWRAPRPKDPTTWRLRQTRALEFIPGLAVSAARGHAKAPWDERMVGVVQMGNRKQGSKRWATGAGESSSSPLGVAAGLSESARSVGEQPFADQRQVPPLVPAGGCRYVHWCSCDRGRRRWRAPRRLPSAGYPNPASLRPAPVTSSPVGQVGGREPTANLGDLDRRPTHKIRS